jgi:hypothetical protein
LVTIGVEAVAYSVSRPPRFYRDYRTLLLARITSHIEHASDIVSSFQQYVDRSLKKPYEIEHLWADHFEAHRHEFDNAHDFESYRNRLGGLVLLPRGFNQSLGDKPYEAKRPHYYAQNLLAASLDPQAYTNNPTFLRYIRESDLPFKSHDHFNRQDLITRQELYLRICERIWNPAWFGQQLEEVVE